MLLHVNYEPFENKDHKEEDSGPPLTGETERPPSPDGIIAVAEIHYENCARRLMKICSQ
jgi:hypothetical protein